MSSFLSVETDERYVHSSSFGHLPTHIDFGTAWFIPLALLVVIGVSALVRFSASQNKLASLDEEAESQAARPVSADDFPEHRPKHIGVIMDGNRRFGRQKHGVPTKGHWDGGNKLIEFVKWCLAAKIPVVTVYAFSSENWNRPQHEVNVLMQIFVRYCNRIEEESRRKGIRVCFLSTSAERFAPEVLARFRQVEEASKHCTNLTLNVCVSYGAREELALACQRVAARVVRGELKANEISTQDIAASLLTCDVPDPDLILRTSGEQRLSNFLLFQAAYSEFVFVDKFWPAITRDDFKSVLCEFSRRKRRFGK